MPSLAPPAIRCSGRPAFWARRSQSAVSMAASAIEVMALTVVAWTRKNRASPKPLDLLGLAADEDRREMVVDQLADRGAARANGVAVASADGAVRIGDAHH